MRTKIISPDELDVLATVPQSVDNQCVPQKVFDRIKGGSSLRSLLDQVLGGKIEDDAKELWEFQKREYNRSLVFSKQVVVNRSSFWNTPVLIQSALDPNEIDGLVKLIKQRAITPYLFTENNFEQMPATGFGVIGEEAIKRITSVLDEMVCVRLAETDSENKEKVLGMEETFRAQIAGPILAGTERNRKAQSIARALLEKVGSPAQEEIEALADEILSVSRFAFNALGDGKDVRRNHLYMQKIVAEGTKPEQGIYRTDKFTYYIKQWFDAIYNCNLPNFLGALSFVPQDFPTPLDLGMTWALTNKKTQLLQGDDLYLKDVVERAKSFNTWKAWESFQAQAGLCIPDPHLLTHTDIWEIRQWPEWVYLMGRLDTFLDNFGEAHDKEMWEGYDNFNGRLSGWWLQKHAEERTRFAVAVGKVYKIGTWVLGYILTQFGVIPVIPDRLAEVPNLDKEFVQGVVEVGLYVLDKGRIDWKRSQNIRRMKKELAIKTDDVRSVWEALRTLYPSLPETLPGSGNLEISVEEGAD
ncbi:MAG: hypothetical protein C4583_07310 [Anaerolineaceae bacterium]|nr:MAG: hypothetical protein C4583_07310 [Anaerolineaceae bacterium]